MSELNDRVTSSAIYIYMIVLVEEWINITNNQPYVLEQLVSFLEPI